MCKISKKQTMMVCIVAIIVISLSGCKDNLRASVTKETESETAMTYEDTATLPEENSATFSEDGSLSSQNSSEQIQKGLIVEQILSSTDGEIHYSYFLPEDYDENQKYPLMVVMPGYDMMWFGEASAGRNLSWSGFLSWTELDTKMIVVSAQLTDWHETSAKQAIELTEYFISHFSVDTKRVYAAGYSAGGETMSLAVSMRPDLYAAYLHGASQWDGDYAPIVQNGVAVYIYMAKSDEYYGSAKAQEAYDKIYRAYEAEGWDAQDINNVLKLEIPEDSFFNEQGLYHNYHGAANVVFDDPDNLNWIISHKKDNSMKSIMKIKIIVDAGMTVALLLLMAYGLVGEQAHEWIGIGMFVLFVLHHILNYRWLSAIGKGKYTPVRMIQTILAVSILLCMIGSMISGIVLSRYVFEFLPEHGSYELAGEMHIFCAYWGFVLMSLHLGMHWQMMLGIAGKYIKPSKNRTWLLRIMSGVLAIYGIVAFVRRDFGIYLLLKSHFVFFDYTKPVIYFLRDYLAVMCLFVFVGYWMTRWLKSFSRVRYKNN